MNLQTFSRTLLCGELPFPNPIFSDTPSKTIAIVLLLNICLTLRGRKELYRDSIFISE